VYGNSDLEFTELKKIIRMKESEYQSVMQKNIDARHEIKYLKQRIIEHEKE